MNLDSNKTIKEQRIELQNARAILSKEEYERITVAVIPRKCNTTEKLFNAAFMDHSEDKEMFVLTFEAANGKLKRFESIKFGDGYLVAVSDPNQFAKTFFILSYEHIIEYDKSIIGVASVMEAIITERLHDDCDVSNKILDYVIQTM